MRRTATSQTALTKALQLDKPQGEEISPEELAKRQRGPTRGERKRLLREAVIDISHASRNTVVLSHIHPRSARRAAEAELDAADARAADILARAQAINAGGSLDDALEIGLGPLDQDQVDTLVRAAEADGLAITDNRS